MSDLLQFLIGIGLDKYHGKFHEVEIEFEDLVELSDDDFMELGLPLGPRRRIQAEIRRIAEASTVELTAATTDGIDKKSQTGGFQNQTDAERRLVTVSFVDLVGSTELSRRLDPEDTREILLEFQSIVSEAVKSFDGHLARYMGDGVLSYYGYPTSSELDAENALRAALEIKANVKKLSAPDGAKLSVRIGVATGLVVIGDLIGEGEAKERSVIGEAPNLAARLQSLAEPGQVLTDIETRELASSVLDTAYRGARKLKGIDEPADVYEVLATKDALSRSIDAATEGADVNLFGRDTELTIIKSLWERACAGEGGALLIEGAAGIGKSGLLQATISRIAASGGHIVNQCSPYHSNLAFHPIVERGTRASGIDGGDNANQKLEKLARLFDVQDQDATLIAWMFGLGEIEGRELSQPPQEARQSVMRVLRDKIAHLSEERPVLLIYEDIHWSDPSTLELIRTSIEAYASRKILILLTIRPDHENQLSMLGDISHLVVGKLTNDKVRDYIQHIDSKSIFSDEIVSKIIERSDGIPLYVQELVRTVRDRLTGEKISRETLVATSSIDQLIPTTLLASLTARLDQLGEDRKFAQLAACLGRTGEIEILSSLCGFGLMVTLEKLENLRRNGLILPFDADSGNFTFTHALVRDAAYDSILRRVRKEIHNQLFKLISERQSLNEESNLAELIFHAEHAEMFEEQNELTILIANIELSRSAYNEALAWLQSALNLLEDRPHSPDNLRKQVEIKLQTRAALFPLGRHGEWKQNVEEAATGALELHDDRQLSRANGYLVTFHYIMRDHQQAIAHGELGLEAAVRANDLASRVNNSFNLSLPLIAQGKFDRGLELLSDIVELTKDDPYQQHGLAGHPAVMARSCAANILMQRGEIDKAKATCSELAKLIPGTKSSFTRVIAAGGIGSVETWTGNPQSAAQRLSEAFDEARQMSIWMLVTQTGIMLADALLLLADNEKALKIAEQSIDPKLLQAMPVGFCYPWATVIRARMATQNWLAAQEAMLPAISNAEKTGERPRLAEVLTLQLELEFTRPGGQPSKVLDSFEYACEIASELSLAKLVNAQSVLAKKIY